MDFSRKTVLVTGASGFLGSHLCERLLEKGADVHATSRTVGHQGGASRWWQTELREKDEVAQLLRTVRPDVVFHLAGLVSARPDLDLVLPTFHSLTASTIHILTAATELGCRVVLTGSLTEPKASDAQPVPASPYAAAKWAASAYGRMFHQLYQTPVVITRPFMTFGPRQHVTKIIPYVTLSLLRQEAPELSSGRWETDWIYIDDVVDGMMAAALVQGIEGRTFDLGSGTLLPVRTIVQHLVELTGSRLDPRFGALPDRPGEQERAADIQASETALGWKPATPLIEGLRRTVDWYRHQFEQQYVQT